MTLGEQVETRLAAGVAYVLGVRAVRRDLRTGKRIRDFDLCGLAGRPDEPLEVTWFAREPVLRTRARLREGDRLAPSLARSWLVDVPSEGEAGAYDARRFRREAEPAIAELERAGYECFDTAQWFRDARVKPALLALAALGCNFGFSSEPEAGGGARIHPVSSDGGRVDRDLVPAAVEAEAAKADNRRKLQAPADALRRHLLVYIDSSTGVTFSAASHGDMGRLPVLPDPITTAWVAGGGGSLFVCTPPGAWEEYRVPLDVFEHPERWIDLV